MLYFIARRKNVFNYIYQTNFYFKTRSKKFSIDVKSASFPLPKSLARFTKEENDEFMSMYPQFVQDICSIEPYNKFPNIISSIKYMLDYNVTKGLNSSGLVTVYAYKMIAKAENQTPENIRLAIIMGWCMRLYEVLVIMLDDLLDNSLQRFQQPSWHSVPHVGRSAALHLLLINNCIYYLLHKYFASHSQYKNMQHLFALANLNANFSQCLDVQPYEERNLTKEYLDASYYGKAAFTTINTFVMMAVYFADIRDPKLCELIQKILKPVGTLWQIQNDFLDSFIDPEKREPGTDIKGSRITWLSLTAYNKCNSMQKKLFRNNYGRSSQEAVNKIISLYKELDMPKVFEETCQTFENQILNDIKKLPNDIIPHELFYRILSNVHQNLSLTN